jgi:hypothetical protein
MADQRKSPGKVDTKTRRDKRLAEALRANLRRRKAAETAEKRPGGGGSPEAAEDAPNERDDG